MNLKLNIIPLSLQYKQTTDSLLYYLSISIIIGKNMTAKELDITQVKDRLAPYNHLTEDTAPNAVELSVEVNPLGNISVRPTNLSIIVSSSKSYEIENVILLNGRVKTYFNGCIFKIHPLRYTVKYTSTGVFSKIGKF